MSEGSLDRRRWAVMWLFFLSGASGLVYQVVWVRQLARVLGNTVHSASLVTGVFMGGLGAGSYVLGRLGDRRHAREARAPLRLYGLAELGIAAIGLLYAIVLPRLAPFSAAISSYERGEHGWMELSTSAHVIRYAVTLLGLGPATFLMGGTLTLLIRFLVGVEVGRAGARIGMLYGLNTAGAALGAWLTDAAFVPHLGIFGAQLVAVALNLVAGLGALAVHRSMPAGAPPQAEPDTPVTEEEHRDAPSTPADDGARTLVWLAALSLGLSGVGALGFEILWFRYLSEILGSYRAVFSLLLTVILVGIWLGATLSGALVRRFGRAGLLFLVSQTALVVTTVTLLGFVDHGALFDAELARMQASLLAGQTEGRALAELWSNLRPIAILTALPALLMGFTYPLGNAVIQRVPATVAGRAGALYLANTLGNVVGSFLVGFVLLPGVGIQKTALALGVTAGASLVPMAVGLLRDRSAAADRSLTTAAFAGIALAAVSLYAFADLPPQTLLRPSLPADDQGGSRRILSISEGLNETLVITEVPGLEVRLSTNGHPMSSSNPKAQRYMRAFSHLPLLQMEQPKDVLVICFGVGSTLHAASLHPSIERLSIADISRHILDHASFFAGSNHDVLADPRVQVFVNDGRHHLSMVPEGSYDLVTLEPPPIAFAQVSALYTKEFYALAKSRLKPGGYLTQWLPGYQVGGPAVLSMVKAFTEVFPGAVLLSGSEAELILMGTTGPSLTFDPAAIARRIEAAPRVKEDLAKVDLGTMVELLGMFAASSETLARATKDAPALTDDRPSLEYSRTSHLAAIGAVGMPPELFDVTGIERHCPGCTARISGLAEHLGVLSHVYASKAFLFYAMTPEGGRYQAPADEVSRRAIARSGYLRDLFGGQPGLARRHAARHLGEGDLEGAVFTARHAVHLDPKNADGYRLLGRAHAATGELDAAAFAFERATSLDPKDAEGHLQFAMVLRRLGQLPAAVEQFGLGLAIDPDDAEGHFERGIALQALGRKDIAEEDFNAALTLEPGFPRAHAVLCKRAVARQEYARAIEHCDLAADHGVPISPELLASLAPHREHRPR
ncbi:MAG: tetratricopeptide repeat protein [Byssovorax sp.]